MDNTVGSLSNLLINPKESYILGLWGADKYLRTSSIGLSNTNQRLIKEFLDFLLQRFPKERIRLRVYGDKADILHEFKEFKISSCKTSRNVKLALHVYVNSRPLVREFTGALVNRHMLSGESLYAYFAGRFDGDGSVARNEKYKFFRIVYKDLNELNKDRSIIPDSIKTSVYDYKAAGTHCLYYSEYTLMQFVNRISIYSLSGKL